MKEISKIVTSIQSLTLYTDYLRFIKHDLINLLGLIGQQSRYVIDKKDKYTSQTVIVFRKINMYCKKLGLALSDVRNDKSKMIKSIKEVISASQGLLELLTPEFITLASRLYAETFKVPVDAEESTWRPTWFAKNSINALKLILKGVIEPNTSKTKAVNINKLLDIAHAATLYEHRNSIKVQLKYCSKNPCLLGNESEIFRIFSNLFKNADEAIKEDIGIVNINIEIIADYVQIIVADTGIGLSKENVEKFNAGKPIPSPKEGQHGLWLTIVSDLVAKNNGTITVQSVTQDDIEKATGRDTTTGTTFTIKFPLHHETQKLSEQHKSRSRTIAESS